MEFDLTIVTEQRERLMGILVQMTEMVSDYEFSQDLIIKLATNFSYDVEDFGTQNVALKTEGSGVTALYKTLPSLTEDLSYVEPEYLIALLANAVAMQRDRELSEAKAKVAKPLSLTTECVCGHSLNWHDRDESSRPCKMYCTCHRFTEKEINIDLTPGGTVTDCVGGSCGCPEAAHE